MYRVLELERHIMINLGNRLGLLHKDTIQQSQRLDILIMMRQRKIRSVMISHVA